MVQFIDLMNKKENRQVREIVFIKGETIRVFEPSKDDIDAIIALQGEFIKELEDGGSKVSITGEQIIKTLFPLLTDVSGMDGLSEEEIDEVIQNPSLALLQASHAIEGIVTEVYKMTILSARNRLLESDLALEDARTTNEMLVKILGLAEREGKTKQMVDNIKKASEGLELAKEKALATKDSQVKEFASNVTHIDKNANTLSKFKQAFEEDDSKE